MAAMRRPARGQTTVVSRPAARRRWPPIRTAYDHFLIWLDGEGVERFDHLVVDHAPVYRARLASTPGRHGRLLRPDTLHDSHRAIGTSWAGRAGRAMGRTCLALLLGPDVATDVRPTASCSRFKRSLIAESLRR